MKFESIAVLLYIFFCCFAFYRFIHRHSFNLFGGASSCALFSVHFLRCALFLLHFNNSFNMVQLISSRRLFCLLLDSSFCHKTKKYCPLLDPRPSSACHFLSFSVARHKVFSLLPFSTFKTYCVHLMQFFVHFFP